MANSFTPFFLALLFILITSTEVLENVIGHPDLTFVSGLCGFEHDTSGFRKGQAARITSAEIERTSYHSPFCSATGDDEGTPRMYGISTCLDSLSQEDCKYCLTYCQDQLLNDNICHDMYGAQLTVASCSLRYEVYEMEECTSS